MKALLVDDEPGFLEQAEIFLKEQDERISVDTATSAEKGLEMLENGSYDVVISDYKMSGLNGLQFLKRIKRKDDNLPFLLLTGKGGKDLAREALSLGADRYIEKRENPTSQYGILADAIVEEVANKGQLSPREIHLVERGVPSAYTLYRNALAEGKEGICISTDHPRAVKSGRGVTSGKLIWLSSKGGEKSISPTDLEDLRDVIYDFAEREGEKGTVLLDGIEYLSTVNGFNRTLTFFHDLREKIALTGSKLIIPISTTALERRKVALLERYSVVMEAVQRRKPGSEERKG